MDKEPEVSVVIPTYNERGNILRLIRAVSKELLIIGKTFEILVVDDNSSDGTAKVVSKYGVVHREVRLIVRKLNPGLGNSILDGVMNARGKVIVGMDADFNHLPQYMSKLLNTLDEGSLVVGSRFVGGLGEKFRHLSSFLFNLSLRLVGFPILDNTSGYYAIGKKELLSLPVDRIYRGYGDYHLRLVYYAKEMGIMVKEVPVIYGKRSYGRSKTRWFVMLGEYYMAAWKLIRENKVF